MIPYTVERRADTGVTNVTMGIWLFLASEVMLFGALFSAYALLRASAPSWPDGRSVLGLGVASVNTVLLLASTGSLWRARPASASARAFWILLSMVIALTFLVVKGIEYRDETSRGLVPAATTFLAMYFTLTGLHALHVAGGVVASLWLLVGRARVDPRMTSGRLDAVALYWVFVDVVWIVIFTLFYLL